VIAACNSILDALHFCRLRVVSQVVKKVVQALCEAEGIETWEQSHCCLPVGRLAMEVCLTPSEAFYCRYSVAHRG